MSTETEGIKKNIEETIRNHPIVLFMKGNQHFPQCGFSAQAVAFLQECQAKFTTVDVLEDENLRQEVKAFSNWPTLPQLYIDGEFMGGCDIMREMFESGELQTKIRKIQEKETKE